MLLRGRSLIVLSLACGAPALARAQQGAPASSEVVITAQRLDQARDSIQPQIGASTYTVTAQAIQSMPGGQNAALNQVILQAPGAVQDSDGQLHIRGEHNGLQFRLDGVILPEGLSVFSQALSPRLASSVELITGALPAEYGLRTAGIVDIKTKTGGKPGGTVSIYGGSHGDIEPSVDYSGNVGGTDVFVSAAYKQNGLGIESPDGRSDPLHDQTRQFQGFAYLSRTLDANNRLSLILGSSDQTFQIPDVTGGLNGGLGLTVAGASDFPSEKLNQNQTEATQYAIVSYLHAGDRFTSQVSLFGRYSSLTFSPDARGDILYNGISQTADKKDAAAGLQAEAVYPLGTAHILRGGVLLQADRAESRTTSQVMLINNDPASPGFGDQIGSRPITLNDHSARTAVTMSLYLQDEWTVIDGVTLNYGLRLDRFDGLRDESQLSPRVNLVWRPTVATTVHAGYARYFSPPPFETVGSAVATFTAPTGNPAVTTSAAPAVTANTAPYAERADYLDVGVQQKLSRRFTAGLDSYFKRSDHLIDEGQFGAPIILTPFNYRTGRQWGVELTLAYADGPLNAYANLSHSVAIGRGLVSGQFSFDQATLDYAADHDVSLDHDEAYAVSAGLSYLWRGVRVGGDMIYGSGLRADLPLASPIAYPDGAVLNAIPNGASTPAYVQVNLALSKRFGSGLLEGTELRLDVINLLDRRYAIRDGSGVGVFAPQYGPRRGIFAGISRSF